MKTYLENALEKQGQLARTILRIGGTNSQWENLGWEESAVNGEFQKWDGSVGLSETNSGELTVQTAAWTQQTENPVDMADISAFFQHDARRFREE